MLTLQTFNKAIVVAKSDTVDLPLVSDRQPDALWVSEAGVVVCVFGNGQVVPFTCAAGTLLPISCKRINSTNTPGTLFVALWQT